MHLFGVFIQVIITMYGTMNLKFVYRFEPCRPKHLSVFLHLYACFVYTFAHTQAKYVEVSTKHFLKISIVTKDVYLNYSQNNLKFNPLNAELNPIYHFLALLGAHPFLHISGVRVNNYRTFGATFRHNWPQCRDVQFSSFFDKKNL